MENFITGYPGHESQHRAAMRKVLGPDKYEFFFDKWLEYFFTEADARFFAGLGLNCIRIPFNFRHFEDDMNPRVLKETGFKHLDRVIALVSICQAKRENNADIGIVCQRAHIHHPGHAYRAGWPECGLALG